MEDLEIPVTSARMNEAEHLEDSVVAALRSMGYDAEGKGADPRYSDVSVRWISTFGIEVKQASAQFGSGRISWDGDTWQTTQASLHDPFMQAMVSELNSSAYIREEFIEKLRKYVATMRRLNGSDLPKIRLLRSNSGKKYLISSPLDPIVQPLELLSFCQQRKDHQDLFKEIRDAAPLIQIHYLQGKKEIAPYLQWEDNFYTFCEDHPLKDQVIGNGKIPMFENVKTRFRISVAFASDKRYYCVIPRIHPLTLTKSPYSLLSPMKPRSKKIFPFVPTQYAHEHLKERFKKFESMLASAAHTFGDHSQSNGILER